MQLPGSPCDQASGETILPEQRGRGNTSIRRGSYARSVPQRVLTTKLPVDLVGRLGVVAAERGVTRNRLVRDALEAVVDGRVAPLYGEDRERQEVRAVFGRIELDRLALRAMHR